MPDKQHADWAETLVFAFLVLAASGSIGIILAAIFNLTGD